MPLFRRKTPVKPTRRYDPQTQTPAMRCSICTGEKTVGFRDRATGRFTDILLIRSDQDLADFCAEYGVAMDDIEKFY